MKRLLSILLFLLLLSAAVVWVAPVLVDFNAFRQDIEKQISAATGRDISIAGDISMRLLPEPALQVQKVSVRNAGQDKSEQAALAVEELRLNAEFWPLLDKQVKLTSVHLVRPEIYLEKLAPAASGAQQALPEGDDAVTDQLIAAVSLDAVKIIDGRISFSADAPAFERINAELHAPTLNGPYSISGTIGLGELALAMDITTGRLGEGQALPVEATFLTQDTLSSFSYNGVIKLEGDAGLDGNFQLAIKDPLTTLARAGQTAPGILGMFGNVAARGTVGLNKQGVSLSSLEMTLDESKLAGDISYTGAQGKETAALVMSLTSDALDIGKLTSGDKADEGLFKTLDHTDLPRMALDADAKLNITQLTQGKNTYSDVQLALTYQDGALSVDTLRAVLPGDTVLALKGRIVPEGVRETAVLSNFDMVADLTTANPQALLKAFGAGPVPALGADLSFIGRLQGATNGMKITDATLKTGASEIVFSGSYVDSKTPRIDITASCKNLALPESAEDAKNDGAAQDGLDKYSITFDLHCDALSRGTVALKQLHLKGASDAEGLRLSEPSGFVLDGLNVTAQGSIGQLSPLADLDLKLGLKGKDAAMALGKLGLPQGDWAQMKLFRDVDLVADFTGDLDNAAFSLKGDLSGIDLQLGGTAEDITGEDTVFDGKIRLQHQDAAKALDILLPDSKKPGKIYGNLDLYTAIKGGRDKLELSGITGKIGDITFSGRTLADLEESPIMLDVALQTTTIDLNKLGLTDSAGGNGGATAQGQWAKDTLARIVPDNVDGKLQLTMDGLVFGQTKLTGIAGAASLQGGALTISQLDADTMGGRLGLTGMLDQKTETLNADVDITMSGVQSLPLFKAIGLGDAIDGAGDVTIKLAATGKSEHALVNSLNGTVTYLSQGGTLNGVDLERVSNRLEELTTDGKISTRLLQALEGGKTPYETAQADIRFKNGVGTIKTGEIITPSGTINGKGRIDLPRWRIDVESRIKLQRPEGIPPLDMGLKGPLHSPQKSLGTDLIRQYLADKFARTLEKKFFGGPEEQDPNSPAPLNDGDKQDNKFPNLPVNPEDAFKKLLKNL